MGNSEKVLEFAAAGALVGIRFAWNWVKKRWLDRKKERKEIEENEPEIKNLKNKIEALTRQMEEKGKENITDKDANRVNQLLAEVRHLQAVIKEDVTLEEGFNTWLYTEAVKDVEMDVEDLADFFKARLTKFIAESRRAGVRRRRLVKYDELLSAIQVNHKWFEEAGLKAQMGLAQDEARKAEYYLRVSLKEAAAMLSRGS